MTLMDDVTKLQERLAAAQRESDRAEGAYITALATVDTAHADLKRDFGVNSLDEGERLLNDLKTRLATIVEDLNTTLDQIEAA